MNATSTDRQIEIFRHSVFRALEKLQNLNFVYTSGKGRASLHHIKPVALAKVKVFDSKTYNKINLESRALGFVSHLEVLEASDLAEHEELFEGGKRKYAGLNNLSETLRRKTWERFVIELSWKSSAIEGNTYNLLDTERLIREGIEAPGHSREEALMILNHKDAFTNI